MPVRRAITHGHRLTPEEIEEKMPRAALALSAGMTYDRAAKLAGCNLNTIRRWMQNQEFVDSVQQGREFLQNSMEPSLLYCIHLAQDLIIDALSGKIDEQDRWRAELAERVLARTLYRLVVLNNGGESEFTAHPPSRPT